MASRRGALIAGRLRGWIEGVIRHHPRLLVAWDSPLSFDRTCGYSDRPVDRGLRKILSRAIRDGIIDKGAVSAAVHRLPALGLELRRPSACRLATRQPI